MSVLCQMSREPNLCLDIDQNRTWRSEEGLSHADFATILTYLF